MRAIDYICNNGRYTRALSLVILTVSASSPCGNYWCSSEYNPNNSWNINFTNGNVNNNNKYNSNNVRAVAALDDVIKEGWIEAYEDCCSNKLKSSQCILYRQYMTRDLFKLASEVENRIYQPSESFCFIIRTPRLREVFAANFRDRIVQHWIALRLNPLFEEKFIEQNNVSFNCRKGLGTKAAIESIDLGFKYVSDNYHRPAWVGKFDIRSFFMSIDKTVLWTKLRDFILEKYKGNDLDTLLYLTKVTIFNCPERNCIKKGRLDLWGYLPAHKSLFNTEPNFGLPIGNITSQLFANFLLSIFDEAMIQECKRFDADYDRFMDDWEVSAETVEAVTHLRRFAQHFLANELNLTLSPNKVYIQPITHGVKMIGQVIKPNRLYTSNETLGNMIEVIKKADKVCQLIVKYGPDEDKLRYISHAYSSLNSFGGFTCRTASHNRKLEFYKTFTSPDFWKVYYFDSIDLNVIKLRKKYKLSHFIKQRYDREHNIAA